MYICMYIGLLLFIFDYALKDFMQILIHIVIVIEVYMILFFENKKNY